MKIGKLTSDGRKAFEIPAEAVTETFGLLAARGAGKTNAARVIAEEMFAAGLRFVAIDPVGSWPGLRSSRDGKRSGIPIPIFGGKHGDVPLERTGGKLVAALIVEQNLSAVVDVSTFESEAARKQFLLDFATELYRLNEEPVHLFLEEADDYIPQKPQREEARLVRAWSNIVRRGRARGIGMTIITQRSAVVAKDVLTQVQTLIALRTTSPQDRAAVEAWVKYNDESREILKSLPALEDGEAWVWSPQFLKRTERIRFRLSTTFDSGATPKVGKKRRQRTIADVDVGKIRDEMKATIEKVEADDPTLLKRRVAELERELKRAAKVKPADPVIERVEVPILDEDGHNELHVAKIALEEAGEALRAVEGLLSKVEGRWTVPPSNPRESSTRPTNGAKPAAPERTKPRASGATSSTMPKAERQILTALAQHGDLSLTQAAIIAGYSAKSGGMRNAAGALRAAGFAYGSNSLLAITAEGLGTLGSYDKLPTGAELAAHWYGQLAKAEREILRIVVEAYPHRVSLDHCARVACYSPSSGGVRNAAGKLRTLALVEGSNSGMQASDRLV